MSAATAHVDVLTAEVRALMVGSRQVTLSVYRQLDRVEPCDMHPFGRVRADKNTTGVELVGASKEDGSLVKATSYKPPTVLASTYSDWCVHNFQHLHLARVKIAGRSVSVDDADEVRDWHMDRNTWRFANAELQADVEAEVQAEGLLLDEELAIHEGFERLPLIVLAGLK